MIALGVLAALTFQSTAADSLRALAVSLPDNALITEVRARPLAVRDAVTDALRRSDTVTARRLADAYGAAWDDAFLSREVARFVAWPAGRRAAKAWVDSVRRAGINAYSRDGPAAALRIWHRALVRAVANGDSVGQAALAGNIGSGFLANEQLDSASAWLERARGLAARLGDTRVEANAIGTLAVVAEDRGDWARARELYAEALPLRQRIGDSRGVAADYNNLGLLAQRVGDVDEARRQFEQALALNRRVGREDVAATNLVNLAGLASLSGDFGTADAHYRDALTIWRAHEAWADAASALHGLGQVNLRRGDYPPAQAALRQALDIYRRTGPMAEELGVRRDLAGALAAAGDLQGARDELSRAQRRADATHAAPAARAGIALARADLAVQFNALADAQRFYARAEALYRLATEPGGEAGAQEGRGLLLLARDDPVHAQALFEAALRTEMGAGEQRAAALTRVSLVQALVARGDTMGARRQIEQASADLDRTGDPVGAAAAIGEWAALEARAGKTAPAESLYRVALDRLGDRVAPEIAWRLHAGRASVLRSQGAADSAARELRIALAVLAAPSRSLALPERRSAFLADKWDVYAQLAFLEHDRGRPGAAFIASESMRAREMLELLDRGRVAAPSGAGGDLVTREQDLRRRIAELTSDTDGADGGSDQQREPESTESARATRESLARAQESYAELLLEMREAAPRHADLVAPAARAWRDVAGRLTSDVAFVEYLVSDSGALAFVITTDTLVVVDLGTSRRDLARLVEFARGTIGQRGNGGSTDSLWRGPLRQLYQRLIAPIEDAGLLAGRTRLIVVPHGELNYLPFAALIDREHRDQFLIERYELAMTPSASVWQALGERRRVAAPGGVLAFAPQPASLPGSQREVAAIQRLTHDVHVLTGGDASEAAFRREAPVARVLHLATSGVLNKANPLFSYVQLARSGDQDGRLEVHEVLGLSLAADLVVLSACQTGLGSGVLADVPAGDEWVGLTRAFLHAGAEHVVATLWPVDDWATAALMEGFYSVPDAPNDPTRALATAQRALLSAPATAHPFFWAPFVLTVGGRRHE